MPEEIELHLYATVRVKLQKRYLVEDRKDETISKAIDQAVDEAFPHLDRGFQHVPAALSDVAENMDFSAEVSSVLVDYPADENYENSKDFKLQDDGSYRPYKTGYQTKLPGPESEAAH